MVLDAHVISLAPSSGGSYVHHLLGLGPKRTALPTVPTDEHLFDDVDGKSAGLHADPGNSV